jgi:hypothetical protein
MSLGGTLDNVTITLDAGHWAESSQTVPSHVVLEINVGGMTVGDLPESRSLIAVLRSVGLEPWQIAETKRSYFANASSETMLLVVSIYQTLAPSLQKATLEQVARLVVGGIWQWLGGRLGAQKRAATLAQASERVQQYLVSRDRIAPDDAQELLAQVIDEGFEFIVRLPRTGTRYYIRCDLGGDVRARLSLDELGQFEKLVGKQEQI